MPKRCGVTKTRMKIKVIPLPSVEGRGILLKEEEGMRLGEMLVQDGVVDEEQVAQALSFQKRKRGEMGANGHWEGINYQIGLLLVALGHTSQAVIDQYVEKQETMRKAN